MFFRINMLSIIPHHISCGVYIKTILNKCKDEEGWNEKNLTLEKQHKLLITALKLLPKSSLTWKEFQQICINIDTGTFMACLKEVHEIVSLEQLSETFKAFEGLYSQKHVIKIVSRTSVLGLFLRKIVITYKKMTFQTTNKLIKMLQEYICINSYLDTTNKSFFEDNQSSMEDSLMEEKENVPISPFQFSKVNLESSHLAKDNSFNTECKVEEFITKQINFLTRNNRLALNPSELQKCINEIKNNFPNIKDIHYLSFLNYLRIYESCKTSMSLRMYFDYKSFDKSVDDTDLSDLERHQMKFKRFRYCALNLGMMHCYHGNFNEASISLEEAIKVAQETNDQGCLDQSMFWLILVKKKLNPTSNLNSTQSIKESLEEYLSSDELTNKIDIEYLSYLQLLKNDGLSANDTPSKIFYSLSQICVTSSKTMSNFSELTKSALLDFYGLINNAFIYPQIVLINLYDTVLDEESFVLSLLQLANFLRWKCMYKEGLLVLKFCKMKLPLYSEYVKKLNLFKYQLEFEQNLNDRNIRCAVRIANSVQLIDCGQSVYLSTIINIMHGNFTKALATIQEETLNTNITITSKVKLLLLKIEVLLLSSQPTHVIHEIINVLTITKKHYMLGLTVSVKLYLLHTQILLKSFSKAEHLIFDIIVNTISYGSFIQMGVLFLLYARCLRQKSKEIGNEEQKRNLLDVLGLLDKSYACFHKGNMMSHMKDVYFERALTYNELNYVRERNEASIQYRLLNENLNDIPNVLLL